LTIGPELHECFFCRHPAAALRPYFRNRNSLEAERYSWLCNLCADTQAGRAEEYPRQFEGQSETLQVICYVGNEIIQHLRRMQGYDKPNTGPL
jgi:hypothetical protein